MKRLTIHDFLKVGQVITYASAGVAYTYYIDPAGDNGAAGSVDAPWATLTYALSQMSNDETLGVKTGTYAAENNISCSLDGIGIYAMPGATPIFQAEAAITTWTKTGGQTNVYQAAAVGTVYGTYNGTTHLGTQSSVANVDANENTWYWLDNVLYVHIAGGADPDTAGPMHAAQSANFVATFSGDNVDMTGITIQWGFKVLNLTGASPTLTDCAFNYHCARYGFDTIALTGAGGTVSSCTFTDKDQDYNGASIDITATSSNVTVEDCTFTTIGWGVQVLGGTGHTVTRCTFNNAYEHAFRAAGGTTTLTYCTFIDCDHSLTANGATVTAHHCRAYWTGAGNFKNTGNYGFVGETSATVTFYHCTAANGALLAGHTVQGFYIQAAGTTGTVKNCISYDNHMGFTKSSTPTITATNNCAYSNASGDFYGGFPQGATDLTSDPTFTDAPNHDYTLATGSPCIDAGAALEGINDGYLGDAPDMGYLEAE